MGINLEARHGRTDQDTPVGVYTDFGQIRDALDIHHPVDLTATRLQLHQQIGATSKRPRLAGLLREECHGFANGPWAHVLNVVHAFGSPPAIFSPASRSTWPLPRCRMMGTKPHLSKASTRFTTDEPAKLSTNPETSRQITFMVPGGECVCIRHDTLLGETPPRSTVATKSALE